MIVCVRKAVVCRFMDVELQQRAVEYMSLERKPDLARSTVVAMPPWEKRKSLLLRRMAEREVCPCWLSRLCT